MKAAKIFSLVLILSPLCCTVTYAQSWVKTAAPANYWWTSIAASPDGGKIFTVATNLFISPDRGGTWAGVNVPSQPHWGFQWVSTGTFGNGSNLMLGAKADPEIFLSIDAGQTWHLSGAPAPICSAGVLSANGSDLLVIGESGIYGSARSLFNSTDGGITWLSNNVPNSAWTSVAISSNGMVMAAANANGYVFISTNGASSWTSNSLAGTLTNGSVACCADGSVFVVSGSGEPIFRSTNFGCNWQQTVTPAVLWRQVTCSARGNRMTAVSFDGSVFTSWDGGQTWAYVCNPVPNWSEVAASADGSSLAAVSFLPGPYPIQWQQQGTIYTYSTPSLPVLQMFWQGGKASLTWPAAYSGCVLQQSCSMSPSGWIGMTNPVVPVNQVVVDTANASAFFRLAQP